MSTRTETAGILLIIQGAIGLLGGLVFGVLIPAIGAIILVTGVAPDGEDPVGVGIVLIAAGMISGMMYAVPGVATLVSGIGAQRKKRWARWAGIASSVLCHWFLPPIGIIMTVAVVVLLVSPGNPTGSAFSKM